VKLTQAGQTVLSKKDIGKYYRFYIASTVYAILSYNYSYNIEFGASILEVELENSDGRYSPGGASEIAIGAVGELKEGILVNGAYEIFTKFTGILRQRDYSKDAGKNTVKLTFLDYIVKLQEMDIGSTHADQIFESSDKTHISSEELTENALTQAGMTSLSQVYDFAHANIAPTPEPVIKIVRDLGNPDISGQPLMDGYEINYETGQLTLGVPLDFNAYLVMANYWYYPTGTYVEEWIEDVITEVDTFGNTPLTVNTNLRTTYHAEEGSTATDTMTLNASDVTYNGDTYTAGKVAYTDYDNIQTTLTSANFTVNGSPLSAGEFVAFDARFGRLFMNVSHTGDTIVCTNNYSFSTLQATGIYIPYIDLTTRSVANRFDAISKLKQTLAPNYIISTKGAKIWGRYLSQKTTADYTLELEKSLTYSEDIKDIYTRVKLYGQSNCPHNLMLSQDTTFITGFEYSVHVDELILGYAGEDMGGGWLRFMAQTASGVMSIDRTTARVWFDDVELGRPYATLRSNQQLMMEVNSAIKGGGQSEYRIWFPDTGIWWSSMYPITFYDKNGIELYRLTMHTGHAKNSNGEWLYDDNTGPPYVYTTLPVKLDSNAGSWQVPENMEKNERIIYIGSSSKFRAIQIQMRTPGTDYSLKFEYSSNYIIKPGDTLEDVASGHWIAFGQTVYISSTYAAYIPKKVDMVTSDLTSWCNRSTKSGVGIDNGDYSFYYHNLSNFYADWNTFMDDWLLTTVNGVSAYWVRIRTTRQPTSIAYVLRAGVLRNNNWDNVSDWLGVHYFSYSRDTHLFTDYSTAVTNGTADAPFLEVGAFHEAVSQATYHMHHPNDNWMVSSDNKYFLIPSELFPMDTLDTTTNKLKTDPNKHVIKATFDYWTSSPESINFDKLRDGDPNTQWQLELFSPLAGSQVIFTACFDEIKTIDAIDITCGFFNPDNSTFIGKGARRYDIKNWLSIQYSTDGVNYNYINKETYNFPLNGGESKSFEASVLGENFQAQYIRVVAEQCGLVDYADGRYVISIVDFAVYENIIIKADSKLGVADVVATTTDPTSTVADTNDLRTKIGEKIYKVNEINKNLMTMKSTGDRAYNFLKEYAKNYTRASTEIAYSPHLELGQTIQVIDSVNGVNQNYFIEGLSSNGGAVSLQLAYYP